MQPESYGNPAVFFQRHFAPTITVFLTKLFFFPFFFVVEAIFPRLIQQINSAFWLLTKRKKGKKNTFNICNTCPSSFNCGIQCLFNRLLAALSCRSKQPHKAANYSINFPTLRRSQGWRTRGDCNQRRFGGGKLTNADTRGIW